MTGLAMSQIDELYARIEVVVGAPLHLILVNVAGQKAPVHCGCCCTHLPPGYGLHKGKGSPGLALKPPLYFSYLNV
jgi:hypothetical protein